MRADVDSFIRRDELLIQFCFFLVVVWTTMPRRIHQKRNSIDTAIEELNLDQDLADVLAPATEETKVSTPKDSQKSKTRKSSKRLEPSESLDEAAFDAEVAKLGICLTPGISETDFDAQLEKLETEQSARDSMKQKPVQSSGK